MNKDEQIKRAVEHFLGWSLPKDFSPDAGVSFKPNGGHGTHWWPIGTNILSAEQAKGMFEFCLSGPQPAKEIAGGSAFPTGEWTVDGVHIESSGGMTLRDWYAGKALEGVITHGGLEGNDSSHIAGMVYEMADAMLVARNKT